MIRHPRSEAGAHAEAARGRITPDTSADRADAPSGTERKRLMARLIGVDLPREKRFALALRRFDDALACRVVTDQSGRHLDAAASQWHAMLLDKQDVSAIVRHIDCQDHSSADVARA